MTVKLVLVSNKHVDNTQQDGRKLAVVLYLQPVQSGKWDVQIDGGDLRLHGMKVCAKHGGPKVQHNISITPVGGRLWLFRADRTEHEVCPVIAEDKARYSLLIWYFARSERSQYVAKRKKGEQVQYQYGTTSLDLETEQRAKLFVERLTSNAASAPGIEELKSIFTKLKEEEQTLVASILGINIKKLTQKELIHIRAQDMGRWCNYVQL